MWWWMVMALGALVVGGSGSRKYTHFWQEFQTNRKVSTYIQHTPKNKRNTSFILMTMWIWWEKCALPPTNSSFSNFHHHCRNCMNYRLDEVVMSKPPFWKQIVFAYSITEGRWLELDSRLGRRRLFSNSSFNLFLTLYLILKKR